ncbi:MAG: DUF2889 domain-containing protein [Dethiobacteria bacterium]|jgi:hypothetical protein
MIENLLLQRNWHLSVRYDGGKLISETIYCGTDRELNARLIVQPESLRILNAWWEIYRAPGFAKPEIINISQLRGLEAYFGCGAGLRQALRYLGDHFAVELFSDAVRGVIQAETFLYKERGFPSSEEFEENWTNDYNASCRYYSNIERVSQDWYEYIGYDERTGNLFNRTKTQILSRIGDLYSIVGHFNDSFHGIAADMLLREDGMVEKARGVILRAPDDVCREATATLDTLDCKNILQLNKKDIAFLMGNNQGCTHLIDLISESAATLRLFLDVDDPGSRAGRT